MLCTCKMDILIYMYTFVVVRPIEKKSSERKTHATHYIRIKRRCWKDNNFKRILAWTDRYTRTHEEKINNHKSHSKEMGAIKWNGIKRRFTSVARFHFDMISELSKLHLSSHPIFISQIVTNARWNFYLWPFLWNITYKLKVVGVSIYMCKCVWHP